MTFERKIVAGLEEVKAIVLQCNECKARMSIAPETLHFFPKECPNGHAWNWKVPLEFAESPYGAFVHSLQKLRDPQYDKVAGFKIFLEFDEPKASQ